MLVSCQKYKFRVKPEVRVRKCDGDQHNSYYCFHLLFREVSPKSINILQHTVFYVDCDSHHLHSRWIVSH